MRAAPCLECQVLQRQASPSPSPGFELLIGISAALYAILTLLTIPAIGQIDLARLTAKSLLGGPMLFLLGLTTVYSVVGTVLMVAWLLWYTALIDWARGRGAVLPNNFVAIVCWFVPFINLVHPFVTLRKIRRDTKVRTPLEWWWGLFIFSGTVATAGSAWLIRGGFPLFALGSLLEVVAVLLCWRIVRDFKQADQSWDPRAAMALRDQNESTRASPS